MLTASPVFGPARIEDRQDRPPYVGHAASATARRWRSSLAQRFFATSLAMDRPARFGLHGAHRTRRRGRLGERVVVRSQIEQLCAV